MKSEVRSSQEPPSHFSFLISHLPSLIWWLIPLFGSVLVLVTSYQAVVARRFDSANGITGELLAGSSVGQTFVARYDNLSGVELHLGTYVTGSGPARASIILQLRDGAGSQGVAGHDIATAELPAGTLLSENAWYLFSFPPISDSQDRTYYIDVVSPDGAPGHALTLFWWQPDSANPRGDPYAYGTAYLNGKPQNGDLAFGLHYDPAPLEAAAQVARAMSANLPTQVMVLLFGGTLVAAVALFFLLFALRERERRRRWLRRWSLPFVLGVALLSGLLYLFLVPPWQGPDEHTHFAYAALLDHYNFDYDKVEALYLDGLTPDAPLADAINASMARHNFTRLISGDPDPGAPPDAGATLFTALGKPPAYYWLGAVALRGARLLGIAADPYTNPETALLVLQGVSLALGMVIVALAWLAARIISADDNNWLVLLLPLTVALLPMHTFDTTVFDNDVLAEVAVSALLVALAALLRWPTGWRALALAALAVLVAVGGLFTKPTAEAALPLLAGGLLVWIGLLATRLFERRTGDRVSGKGRALIVPGAMIGLLTLLAFGSLLLAYEPQNQAAGWVTSWWPLFPMPRTETSTAHDGHFVLDLGPAGYQATTAAQVLLPPVYHPAITMTVTGWVRVTPGASTPLVKSPAAVMRIEADASQIGRSEVLLNPAGIWQPISATAHLAEGAQQIVLRITSTNQRAQFDDFSFHVDEGALAWRDPVFQPTLLNPSAESGLWGLKPALADHLPYDLVAVADVLPNPQPFNKLALWGEYANQQYISFWGGFGWLSIPLPDSLYAVLGIICVLALSGLAVRAVRHWGRWTMAGWLGFIALLALIATVLTSYAWQTMRLATQAVIAALAGRYLFVLIIPIVWLLLEGLSELHLLFVYFRHENRDVLTGPTGLPWAVGFYVTGVMLFAAYCFLTLIVPYYYA